jgi:hypothetical protein
MFGGVEVELHVILILALGGGVWSVSCFGVFIPCYTGADSHTAGGWTGLTAGLNIVDSWGPQHHEVPQSSRSPVPVVIKRVIRDSFRETEQTPALSLATTYVKRRNGKEEECNRTQYHQIFCFS